MVGWIGSESTLPYLSVMAPALRRLAQRRQFELRVIANEARPPARMDLSGVTLRFIPWQASTAVKEIRAFDLGVMPLPADEEWTRYKCGMKLLQYMALGIPAVASPVGVNADIICPGANGLLAASDEGWEVAA